MHGVLLLAGGKGKRMGGKIYDKLLHPLHETTSFRLCCEAYLKARVIEDFVIVHRDEEQKLLLKNEFSVACAKSDRKTEPAYVIGGLRRMDSVRNGLTALSENCQFVQVHDCARPMIRTSTISKLAQEVARVQAVAVARPVRDTVRLSSERKLMSGLPQKTFTMDRSKMWFMETPQAIRKDWLIDGINLAVKKKIEATDEVFVVELLGKKTVFYNPEYPNPKITTMEDYKYLNFLLNS